MRAVTERRLQPLKDWPFVADTRRMLTYLAFTTLKALEFGALVTAPIVLGFLALGEKLPVRLVTNFTCWGGAAAVGVAYVGHLAGA